MRISEATSHPRSIARSFRLSFGALPLLARFGRAFALFGRGGNRRKNGLFSWHPRSRAMTLDDKRRDLRASPWRIPKMDIRRDDPCATLCREKRPCPLEEHEDATPETNQVGDVDQSPREPSDEPGELHLLGLGDGTPPTNRGHRPLVHIAEGLPRPSSEIGLDHLGEIAPLLHRNRSKSRKRSLRAFGRERGHVSNRENIRAVGQ